MTVKIGNSQYVTVAERVAAAHQDEGFSMLSEEVISIGSRYFVRIIIEVKGKNYIGSAEIKFDAKPGSPDASNPYECAQTSSLGRCLGFAGYGSAESIASADEMVRSQPAEPSQSRHNGQQDVPFSRPSDVLSARIKALSARAREVGIDDNVKWASMLRYLDIGKIKGEAEIALIESYLTQEAEKREKTTF